MNPSLPFPRPRVPVTRRSFLRTTGGGVAGILALSRAPALSAAEPASSRVRVAVIGLGRGLDHVRSYLQLPNVEIAALCDVDERRITAAAKLIEDKEHRAPAGVRDLRHLLEDRSLDAISVALPNFWHAPATILGCAAGKHVYVEKPGSHNMRESEWMVAAARKHNRRVQMGNQRRSMPIFIQAVQELKSGAIGTLRFARCWYDATRGTIGRGRPAPVPSWLDFSLWQGPAPERPYVDNLVHYNWHWRWHWGGGELANNGVHTLDLARWGLGVTTPSRVACNGGRYHFQDDQETPDTTLAAYDFGASGISWDGSSCLPRREERHPLVTFYGDGGSLSMEWDHYVVRDLNGKEVRTEKGSSSDVPHFANFIASIRDGAALNSEIGEAQRSTRLCHLGNIAYRTRSELAVDAGSGAIRGATRDQRALWGREYRKGWEPKI